MKRFLYMLVACCLLPIILIGAIIYGISKALQMMFNSINLILEKSMNWIDKNITCNIR